MIWPSGPGEGTAEQQRDRAPGRAQARFAGDEADPDEGDGDAQPSAPTRPFLEQNRAEQDQERDLELEHQDRRRGVDTAQAVEGEAVLHRGGHERDDEQLAHQPPRRLHEPDQYQRRQGEAQGHQQDRREMPDGGLGEDHAQAPDERHGETHEDVLGSHTKGP